MPLKFPITKWGGVNYHDQPDALVERSHVLSQGGFTQIPGLGTELAEGENLDYNSRGIGQRKGSTLDVEITLAGGWAQVGNDKVIATMGEPAITGLTATRIAFIDTTNDVIRAYDFDGTDWAQAGNDSAGLVNGAAAITSLSTTRIAFIDNNNKDLRAYDFNGTDWTLAGSELVVATVGEPALAALNSMDIAFIDTTNKELRTYRFNGSIWAQVGNGLGITGFSTVPAIAALNSSRIAWIDPNNDELRIYDWDGTDWSKTGNGLSISITGDVALASLSKTDVMFIDSGADALRTYRFDGVGWSEVGTELNIATVGRPAIASLTSNDIAFVDASNADLRTYRLTEAGKVIAGTSWRSPSTGQRIQALVTETTIFTDQALAGTFTQINNSSGSVFFFDSAVSKVTFTKVDGHLNIHTDGALNYIQTYREGTDLDAELKNGNTYEDSQGGGTNTITGTWPQGAYLGAVVNSRLCWSKGNTLIEFTPGARTTSSGIWDLIGSTAGTFFATGNIVSLISFVPHLTNSFEETLFIGTEVGLEYTSGFLSFDNLVRVEGSTPPLNHKAFFKSRNWIVYLTEDKNIHAVNRHTIINLGRRFKTPQDDGPLDGMSISNSETNSFGFYDRNLERGVLAITTKSTYLNDTWLVLDFKKGEPVSGEPLESFERRVRCLIHKIKNPGGNNWFFDVYQKLGAVVGVLKSGKLYTMETGNNDLGTIAIEAFLKPPVITGGDQFVSQKKSFSRLDIRAVPDSGSSTLSVDVFKDWSSASSKTFSKVLDADVGDIVKISDNLKITAEAIQCKIYNNAVSETFVISSVKQEYEVGAEIRP